MLRFFSEEAVSLHKEYLRQARLRYSILEDGIKEIKNKKYVDILRQKMDKKDREDVLKELSDITLHKVFFSSFSQYEYAPSAYVRDAFGSEAELLNRVYSACMSQDFGFVGVGLVRGKITVVKDTDRVRLLSYCVPRVAIDVCEHAYFLDYGFDKSRYLMACLPFLDLDKLNL